MIERADLVNARDAAVMAKLAVEAKMSEAQTRLLGEMEKLVRIEKKWLAA